MAKKTYSALMCKQNDHRFYLSVIPKDVLIQIAYLVRRSEDPEHGFQRFLNSKRAKAIARYMDEENGNIPSPIILSAQKNSKFAYKSGKISFDTKDLSFLIIDGQHRLFGYAFTQNNFGIPVVIYSGLTISEEVSLFIDINTNQKGVPSALLLDIKQMADRESLTEEKQRIVFDKLMKISPLAGHLSPDRSSSGKISRTTFNSATKNIFENGPLKSKNSNIIYKAFNNFLQASEIILDESRSEKARLNRSLIFKSLFSIFNEVFTKSLSEYGDAKFESLYNILEPIGVINFDSDTGSSNAVVNQLSNEMKNEINKYLQIDEDIF